MDGSPHETNDMRKPLHSLADIRVGHTFRGRIENDPAGTVRVLQIKDIRAGGSIDGATLPRMQWQASGTPPTLEAGDIVVPARGDYSTAAIADGTAPIVPTSQFWVLRTRARSITPEYLCWYLNQSAARTYFSANRTGTNMPMLNKQALGGLPVPVPTRQVQRNIIDLHRMWVDEQQLTEQLLRNRETMLAGIFHRLLES